MKLKLIFILGFFLSLILLYSCNEKPTDIAYELISDTVSINIISHSDAKLIYGIERETIADCGFNVGNFFVGNARGIETFSVIRFAYFPDSVSYLKESNIEEATLFLFPSRYALGDTLNPTFGFKIKKVEKYWSANANYDSLMATGMISYEVGNFEGRINLQDTMKSLEIPLDKRIIADWLQRRTDTNAYVINWGIALFPYSNTNVIHSFNGQGIGSVLLPGLRVIFRDSNNQLDTVSVDAAITSSFIKYPKFDEDKITFQGGLDVRTNIKFDLSMIPPFSGISKMDMQLTIDKENSIIGNLSQIEDFRIDFLPDTAKKLFGNYYYYMEASDTNLTKYYCPSLTSAAEMWNRNDGKGKLQIRGSDMQSLYRRLDRYTFYGINDPDTNKRPKIRVIYTIRRQR